MNTVRTALLLGIAAAAGLAGCASSNDRDHETVVHHDNVKEVATRDPGMARDRETRDAGHMVFEDRVPSTAAEIQQPTRVVDGARRDNALVARPASDGEVWVVDAATGRILYGGHLRRGQTLLANLDRNELTLDGRPLSSVRIDGRRVYKVYWLAG